MNEYIDKAAIYEKVAELEQLAYKQYRNTPRVTPSTDSELARMINRTRDMCLVQLNERTKLKQLIADFQAADVVQVVEGRWVHLGGDEWYCSSCGFVISTEGSWDKPRKKYCEECGTKMTIEGDDHQ